MGYQVLKTGNPTRDEPKPPVDMHGYHHECCPPGRFMRWVCRLKPGARIQCVTWMRSSQDSVVPGLKADGFIPVCGREWEWTGITWVEIAGIA